MINTSIRRALVLSSLVLGATTLFSAKAMAGSVTLNGTVPSTLTLTTSPITAAALALPLSSPIQQIVQVADLAISTNNEQGYTVTATSGNLTKTGGTSIAYRVTTTADGGSIPAPGVFAAAAANHTFASSAANALNSNGRDLYIMYTPAALQDPGLYEGSITVSVIDN